MLIFVGVKMALVDVFKIPPVLSLTVIALMLGGSVVASLFRARRAEAEAATPGTPPVLELRGGS